MLELLAQYYETIETWVQYALVMELDAPAVHTYWEEHC